MFHSALLKKTFQLYEQRFCHAKSSENMAKQVYCMEDRFSDVLFSDPFPKNSPKKKRHPKLQEKMAGNLSCLLLSSVLHGGGRGYFLVIG